METDWLNEKNVTIDRYNCVKVDEWQNATGSYILGRDTGDDAFFYAQVTENNEQWKGVYNYEFDAKPTRGHVEEEHINRISELDIDAHEAEYGADGNSAFPYLNDDSNLEVNSPFSHDELNLAIIRLDGKNCFKIDEWQRGGVENFVIGRDVENDNIFYYRIINNSEQWEYDITYKIEEKLSRSNIEEYYDAMENPEIWGYGNDFHIQNFEVKNDIYMANFTYNGKRNQKAVWRQGEEYYISTGSAVEGNLTRHNLSIDEANRFQEFIRTEKKVKEDSIQNGKDILNQMIDDIASNDSVWGSWSARVVDARNPTDYVDIDIMGYSTINSVRVKVSDVRDNVIVNSKTFDINAENNDNFNNAKLANEDTYEFLQESINRLGNFGTKYIGKETAEHSAVLESMGYSALPIVPERNLGKENSEAGLGLQSQDEERSIEMAHSKTSEVSGIEQGGEAVSAKDKLKETLITGIQSVMNSEEFKNWLQTGGKLFYNNYSFNNAMLVWLQKPDASYVMGYEAWKDFGRNVTQGAQGAKIFMPVMASENSKGGLFRMIKNNLLAQLSKDTSLQQAVFRLGQSNLEFTMNRAGLFGRRINGIEKGIFDNEEMCKQYIERSILGKTPMYFNVGTVFDSKDVSIPEFLWVKSGYTKEELVKDENDKPIKNKKGQFKIYNMPERQARFNTNLNTYIVAKDPQKMKVLLDVCIAVSEKKGIRVYMRDAETDEKIKGGAKGYFSRKTSDENPKGFIVLDKTLEPTELCAVMFHEMGHSDMHKNLDALAQKLGEEKITKSMREIQAEAVAYMTASTFGIETDTSSFAYLAAYTNGFELQEFQKSIEVIYSECQQLISDIRVELDINNLDLDLTQKEINPLEKESLIDISSSYIKFALEKEEYICDAMSELPSLVAQNHKNAEIIEVLKEQKKNIDKQTEDIEIIKTSVDLLSQIDSRKEQDNCIAMLDSAKIRLNDNVVAFDILTERYIFLNEQARVSLKSEFDKQPLETLKRMKENYPRLKRLSEAELKYIAKSKFIAREYSKFLRSEPEKFIELVCERAERINSIASKNGTFVEIVSCEQWGDSPIVEGGTMCHPKVANEIIKQGETQIKQLKEQAKRDGEYYPFTKCAINIFTPTVTGGGMSSLSTRVVIGTGEQNNLFDHMESICKRGIKKEICTNFEVASKERGTNRKIIVPEEFKKNSMNDVEKEINLAKTKTRNEWKEAIDSVKQQDVEKHKRKDKENTKEL